LVKTPIVGTHITFLNLFLGFVSAALFALGNYGGVLLGALVFHMVSVLDGCDGELAKIKLQDNKKGKLLDTLVDNLTYLVFLLGVMIGFYRQEGGSYILIVGLLTIFDALLAWNLMANYLNRLGRLALPSFQEATFSLDREFRSKVLTHTSTLERLVSMSKFFVRRDFFAFFVLLLALFGKLPWIFWFAFLITHLNVFAIFSQQTRWFAREKNPSEILRPQS